MARQFRSKNPPQVSYDESARSGMRIGHDGQSAVRYFQCDGKDKNDLITSMLGYTKVKQVGTVATLSRCPPDWHPERPNLFARSVEYVREIGPPSPEGPYASLQFDEVEVAINYEATPGIKWLSDEDRPANFNLSDESWRYISFLKTYDLEARILPKGILYFNKIIPPDAPGKHRPVPEPGTVMQATFSLRCVFREVPVVYDLDGTPRLPGKMEENWAATIGRMNSVAFRGFAKQTLFCTAPTLEMGSQADGTDCFHITMLFLGRGEKDVSIEPLESDTGTADYTRLINSEGLYSRVFRSSDPTGVTSLYRPADFKRMFDLH